jgi:ribonuclease D
MSALPPPLLIADTATLSVLVADLATCHRVAVDTESNSLHAYREQVCLIQFSSATRDYLVDPLALRDLSPLAAFFASPDHEKIFHAADGDLRGLGRDFGFTFANIFDTMSAARTLGWPQVGLAAILKAEFDVTLQKTHQRADWGRRPLRADMLDYARLDTHYLPALRERVYTALVAQDRWAEAQEDFIRLAATPPAPANLEPDPHAFWRVKGARDLAPAHAAVLRAVFLYRERESARANVPPFKILGEPTLLALAQQTPRDRDALTRIVAMTPGQIERHGRALLAAVADGLHAVPPTPPTQVWEPDDVRARFDALHAWRKQQAAARGVESDVIVPKRRLWDLARRPPRTPEDLTTVVDLGPTRRAMYGQALLEILART